VEGDCREDDKDHECDDFLNDLQLHQAETTSVAFESDAISRNLQAVLEESDSPREEDNENERCGVGEETCLLQFKVSVPRERHKYI